MSDKKKTYKSSERKKYARILFVKKGWCIDEIAKHLKVTNSTVNRWRNYDKNTNNDWSKDKAAITIKGRDEQLAEVLNDYLDVHRKIMSELKANENMDTVSKARILASLADTFSRTTKAASKVSPQIDSTVASHEILSKLSSFVVNKHKKHAKIFAEILEAFGDALLEGEIQ